MENQQSMTLTASDPGPENQEWWDKMLKDSDEAFEQAAAEGQHTNAAANARFYADQAAEACKEGYVLSEYVEAAAQHARNAQRMSDVGDFDTASKLAQAAAHMADAAWADARGEYAKAREHKGRALFVLS